MRKVLRPTTIIPQSLYVERGADRQVDQVVSEMGRPAYILVARQMGKTNLLINMKRNREKIGDVAVYFDLSNRFDSSRALFRNIVDAVIDAVADMPPSVLDAVNAQRRDADLAANSEYDRHMRLILNNIQERRLIIILDEIDSLVSVPYSDIVFAQIRSMYFSRINYPIYENFTYILSGVAEPTDLIKDKNISPFNIGEKIYLDDFSISEFEDFLGKAGLEFSRKVTESIFEWTAGNPRMTWDVCAELEDLLLSGGEPTREDVAEVVSKLYLARFDRAPVDHIRVLAESESSVRNAIMSVKWGKGDSLDDKIKSRLYLAGITGVDKGGGVRIKNKIIEAALSDSWLTQVAVGKRNQYEVASEHYQAARYNHAMRIFAEAEKSQEAPMPIGYRFQLALSRIHLEHFEAAINDLKSVLAEISDPELEAVANYYLGLALLKTRHTAESVEYFELAASTEGPLQLAAKVAMVSAQIFTSSDDNIAEIVTRSKEVLREVQELSVAEPDSSADALASAYYNTATAYLMAGDVASSRAYLQSAFEHAPPSIKPAILVERANRAESVSEAEQYLEAAVRAVFDERLRFQLGSSSSLTFSEGVLASILVGLSKDTTQNLFSELFTYASNVLFSNSLPVDQMVVRLVKSLTSVGDTDAVSRFLWLPIDGTIQDIGPVPASTNYAYQLAMYSGEDRKSEALNLLIAAGEDQMKSGEKVEPDVIVRLITHVYELEHRGSFVEGLAFCQRISELNLPNSDNYPVFAMILANQTFFLYRDLEERENAQRAARRLLQLTDPESYDPPDSLKNFTGSLRRTAEAYVRTVTLLDPYRKYGRNDKVKVVHNATGIVSTRKFKQVESDLRAGIYKLIGSNDGNLAEG